MQPNTSQTQPPQQSQQLEGKKSRWKLFSRGKTNNNEALVETGPIPSRSDNVWGTTNITPSGPRPVDANYVSRGPINVSMTNSSAVAIDSGRQGDSPHAVSNTSGIGTTSQIRHTQPQVQSQNHQSQVQTQAQAQRQAEGQPQPEPQPQPQSTASSTASPTVKQETYVDPVTNETTTTTTITTVVTTVVTKPPPTSPVSVGDELDIEEERRLASQLLAASEIDDAHAPRRQGLQPTPISRDRRSKRLTENMPPSERAAIPVDESAAIVPSRPGPNAQRQLPNRHKASHNSQQGHRPESHTQVDDEPFAGVSRPFGQQTSVKQETSVLEIKVP